MQFNSLIFIYCFLPITLFIFYYLKSIRNQKLTVYWLIFASCFFYAWFSIKYLMLILSITSVNYFIGKKLYSTTLHQKLIQKTTLIIGLSINLLPLAWLKYKNFLIENYNYIFNTQHSLFELILPLGISFFTFQNITYLVDSYQKKTAPYCFKDFVLYIVYFPQLVAGPIVHHSDLIPQIQTIATSNLKPKTISSGIILFLCGLIKKICISDTLAEWANVTFQLAETQEAVLGTLQSWSGAISFSLQIYFDFSGYTDMALGLAMMMGIILPNNFNSPCQATSIIEFWRRWHITLSTFLRDYVYIPLGGNRKGSTRRYINLMATMLIGGLWHGAAWSFILWGGLHGLYLCINHLWQKICTTFEVGFISTKSYKVLCWIITHLSVLIAWVFFRAENSSSAFKMLKSMFGLSATTGGKIETWQLLFIISALLFVLSLPNSVRLLRGHLSPHQASAMILDKITHSLWGGVIAGIILGSTIIFQNLKNIDVTPFIYFQF